jgi:hypothetical protein
MMRPIHLNLLAEEELAEAASKHDPVRVAISIAGVLLLLVATTGAATNWWVARVKNQADQLQAQRGKLLAAQSDEGPGDLRAWKGFADDAVAMNQSRSLFAPQLALLKELVPDTIQLGRFNISVSTESAPVVQAVQPGDKGAAPRRLARALNTERVTLQMDGKAEAVRPDIVVKEFIDTIKQHPQLKDIIETVDLRSINVEVGPPPLSGETRPSVARFVIECRYREKR